MNTLSKIAIATATLLSMGALTACQSTATRPDQPQQGHHLRHGHQMTPQEQEQRRANFEQMKQACDGKNAGDAAQVSFKDKTISGQCQLSFRPNPPPAGQAMPQPRDGQPAPQNAQLPPPQDGQPAPAPQNGQLPPPPQNGANGQPPMPPKDHMMKHHKHRGDFKAFQHVCDGRTAGQALKVTFKDKTVFGTCEVQFRPDHRPHKHHFKHEAPANAPAPAAS